MKICIDASKLRPSLTPLKGFLEDLIQPMGIITLPVIAGRGTRTTTTMTEFLVIKAPSSYNAIFRRLTLNNLRVVTSMCHLKMMFLTEGGVGEARGEHALARECYVQDLRRKGG